MRLAKRRISRSVGFEKCPILCKELKQSLKVINRDIICIFNYFNLINSINGLHTY